MERFHGVADPARSIDGIDPESGFGSIGSIEDLDACSSRAAVCAGADTSSGPATCATDDSFDF